MRTALLRTGAHTHSVLPHWRWSRTLRRVRSADPVRPSLQQADRLRRWRQSHRAASARLRAERPQQGERSASAAWEFFLLPLPTLPFGSLPYSAHSLLVGAHRVSQHQGRIAPRLWRGGRRRVLTPVICQSVVGEKLIGNSLKLRLVLVWSPIVLFFFGFWMSLSRRWTWESACQCER